MQRAFYENLYTNAPCDISACDAFLEDPNLVKLDENELNELEQPLPKTECFNVLKQCAKNKCPGSDGLSVEPAICTSGIYLVMNWSKALTMHIN